MKDHLQFYKKWNKISLKVKPGGKTIFVDLEEIEYIESSEGKVYINISREKFIIETTLAETEKNLGMHDFYKCHRSYIVNLNNVRDHYLVQKHIFHCD